MQGNWLTKSIRPLVLAWLVVSTTLLIFIDAGAIDFVVEDKWTDLLQIVLNCYWCVFWIKRVRKNQKWQTIDSD